MGGCRRPTRTSTARCMVRADCACVWRRLGLPPSSPPSAPQADPLPQTPEFSVAFGLCNATTFATAPQHPPADTETNTSDLCGTEIFPFCERTAQHSTGWPGRLGQCIWSAALRLPESAAVFARGAVVAAVVAHRRDIQRTSSHYVANSHSSLTNLLSAFPLEPCK